MFNVDWRAAEESLVREGMTQFTRIAARYPEEEFYGVFFDCDLIYLCAQAHMNTNARLRDSAEQCKNDDLMRDMQVFPGLSVDELMESSRWDGGGWGYFGVFPGPDFPEVAAARDEIYQTVGRTEGYLRPHPGCLPAHGLPGSHSPGTQRCVQRLPPHTRLSRLVCLHPGNH